MIDRLPCIECGALILPDTASETGGLCMPCKRGFRARIEEGKRQRERDREYEQSAERKYWIDLVKRVHGTPLGFTKLCPTEKTYFAVSCLIGEVYNGGFDQFFSTSSGELYYSVLDGLVEMEARASAAILITAKQILFGEENVPEDQTKRLDLMLTVTNDHALKYKQLAELDSAFYADPDKLGERCEAYALTNRLYRSS